MTLPVTEGGTATQLSYLPLPQSSDTVALLTLASAGGPRSRNVLDRAALASLDRALDDALGSSAAGICVTGTGLLFSAGADPRMLAAGMTRTAVLETSAMGQRVFGRLRDAAIPTFALVNGPALGGGAELALHCRYRVLSTAARLGLPECGIGLVPGWGGTQLLPRLADPDTAVRLAVVLPVTDAGPMPAASAHQAGLADVLLARGSFQRDALAWAAAVLAGAIPERPVPCAEGRAWSAAIARGRAAIARSPHATAAAPWRVLGLLAEARHTPLPDGLAAERSALADLVGSDQFRSRVYLHEAVQHVQSEARSARYPGGGRARIAVCGSGRRRRGLRDAWPHGCARR